MTFSLVTFYNAACKYFGGKKLSYSEVTKYINAFYEGVEDHLLEGDRVVLPYKVGILRLTKRKESYRQRFKTDGKIIYQFETGNHIVRLKWVRYRSANKAYSCLRYSTRSKMKKKIIKMLDENPLAINNIEYEGTK